MSLHPVWGHEAEREALSSAAAEEILPAALLFHGSHGIGKQRVAHWLAQLIVCEAPLRDEPCGACPPCRMALSFEHPDIHYYLPLPRPKGASGDRLTEALEEARLTELEDLRTTPLRPSHRDEVRGIYLGAVRNIRSQAHKRPAMSRGPIFIIGEASWSFRCTSIGCRSNLDRRLSISLGLCMHRAGVVISQSCLRKYIFSDR